MIMVRRALWLVVLVCFICGCAGLKPARWPDASTETGADDRELPAVAVGDYVAVELLDGTRVKGYLRAITGDSVIVEVDRGIVVKSGLAKQAIPRSQIAAVSKLHTHLGRTLLLAGGLVVGIGVYVVLTALDDMQFDF